MLRSLHLEVAVSTNIKVQLKAMGYDDTVVYVR